MGALAFCIEGAIDVITRARLHAMAWAIDQYTVTEGREGTKFYALLVFFFFFPFPSPPSFPSSLLPHSPFSHAFSFRRSKLRSSRRPREEKKMERSKRLTRHTMYIMTRIDVDNNEPRIPNPFC